MPHSLFNRIAWQGPVCVCMCVCLRCGWGWGGSFNKIAGTILILFSPGTTSSAGHHVSLCVSISDAPTDIIHFREGGDAVHVGEKGKELG